MNLLFFKNDSRFRLLINSGYLATNKTEFTKIYFTHFSTYRV